MARGDWPTTLDDLVPHFLSEAQRDPFRQDTLLMRQSEEGLIVYSVGPDRIDDGGSVGIEPDQKLPLDIGFRLWDVDKRRQPASTN